MEKEEEKEVVELFEAAKKAADAAYSLDGGAEESRCIDALTRLKNFPITYQLLLSTQVGKRLRNLTKHPRKKIQVFAFDLMRIWKNIVVKKVSGDKNNGSLDNENPAKVEPANAETARAEKVYHTTSAKVEKVLKAENLQTEKVELNGSPRSKKIVESETVVTEETDSVIIPKLTSMFKCNDELRDRIREQLYEALFKVYYEVDEDIRDEVKAYDPDRVAVAVESAMFDMWGRSNGAQKIKYRSAMFNIKDPKNPDFRRKVLLGHVQPERVVYLTTEEMASDKRRHENQQIKNKALLGCERGAEPKATNDQFKCGRCGQHKTTYYQMQTRSADEPMTTYVTCVNCNKRWKC